MTLPKGWAETKIGAIARISSGYGFPDRFQGKRSGDLPFAKVKDLSNAYKTAGGRLSSAANYVDLDEVELLKAAPVDAGSTAFAKIGEALRLNRRVMLEVKTIIDNNCMAITPDEQLVSAEFIYRFMTTVDLSPFAVATTVPSVRRGDVEEIQIFLPPLPEQGRIVKKLDSLTGRIARAKAELDRVPVMAERERLAVLRAGVTGSLTNNLALPGETVDELLAKVPAPTQGRGGREATDKVIVGAAGLAVNDPGTSLPVGWRWVSLLRLAKQETGHTPSRSRADYWDGGVPWIGIRDAGAHHGRHISETQQTISEAGLANSSARLLPAGTVCLSRTASVGYVTIMDRSMATSQDFATWTCSEALLPEYLMYALMAEGEEIKNFGMGSTHTTIYFPEVRAFHIALPPIVEQREIVRKIQLALFRADRLEAEAACARALLGRLESAILAKAFRGELVPQDPNDEPASVLLERIRAARASAPKPKGGRRVAPAKAAACR